MILDDFFEIVGKNDPPNFFLKKFFFVTPEKVLTITTIRIKQHF